VKRAVARNAPRSVATPRAGTAGNWRI
jgi:hypothetical protein